MNKPATRLFDTPNVADSRRDIHAVPVRKISRDQRPRIAGKFFFAGEEKLWIKGVTYGTFQPDANDCQFPSLQQVEQDFVQMAANGINAVRTYTVPPRWLLDAASRKGLRVMVGIPWEQHIAFLDDRARVLSIEERVRTGVRSCAGHAAVLGYAVGNEIPASIVRLYGRRRIERFIENLYRIAKQEDPQGLVTYVNFPTTEYLQLGFLDFICFNVYLESREELEAYLARLQNVADERPLLMAEIGLDSRRHGVESQADSLVWQIQSVFRSGCVGMFVFAWTDEWYRGGYDIDDWDFGLTSRDREVKPALSAVAKAFADSPFPAARIWPRISVVVCSFNGAQTIRDTLRALAEVDYPDYEVIVVNDGSTDDTALIAGEYGVRLISTENRGLSNARNTGYQAATGQIIAYIDDDAYPDPDWLLFLASAYENGDFVGIGGPNLAPPGDGWIADCVAHSPGGPVHVLLSDTVAEHIPGCNMSFRKTALETVGGFDPRYRAAGDDVDICWRIQDQVGTIGFHPAAMVWHHRRNSLRMYWRQQQGYGKAEALLEEKWPERYNDFGHTSWGGRLYGKGVTLSLGALGSRIYQGVWGCAPFQSMYQSVPKTLATLPLMPEWYLLVVVLLGFGLVGFVWPPLFFLIPLTMLALTLPVLQAIFSARKARFTSDVTSCRQRFTLFGLTTLMHLAQPLARLIGRLRHGLTPWRRRGTAGRVSPFPSTVSLWREQWGEPTKVLRALQSAVSTLGAPVAVGSGYDRWDLQVRGGLFAKIRVLMATEEHGGGKQLYRFRIWPSFPIPVLSILAVIIAASIWAALDGAWGISALLGSSAVLITACSMLDAAAAAGTVVAGLRLLEA